MDGLWRMQSMREAASKRDLWKRKVEQVAEESDALRVALDKFGVRQHRRLVEEATRQELMQRRADGKPSMDLGAEVAARKSVQNSKAVLEEAYQTGVGVLGAMAGQRETLKSAQRKVLDVLNAVGLSDSVLRIAERRIAVDKLIAYGGMVLITGLLFGMYWWLNKK
jgi:Golgi SNAP receptor complex protein 2